MDTKVRYYSAYGLLIGSEYELPELYSSRKETAAADVRISKGRLERIPESGTEFSGRRIRAGEKECHLTYDSIGTFLLKQGREIVCDPVSEEVTSKKIFRRLLEKELMAIILLQRGQLVLHASAVSVDGVAAIFLGPRGAGKSTTAAAFFKQGYRVLDDDVVTLRIKDSVPIVVSGVPQLRLSPETVNGLKIKKTNRPSDDWGPEKEYRRLESEPVSAPLGGCYVPREGTNLSMDELTGPDKLLHLVSQTYAQGLLKDTEMTLDHFEQCSAISRSTPFYDLYRPLDHGELPSLVQLVAQNLASHSN